MSGTDELIRGLAERIVERRLQHSGFLAVNIGDAERVESVLRESGLAEVLTAVHVAISLYDSDPQLELREFKARQFLQTALTALRSKVVGQ